MNRKILFVFVLFVAFFTIVSMACSVDLGTSGQTNTIVEEQPVEEQPVEENYSKLDYEEVDCPSFTLSEKGYTGIKCYLLDKKYTSIGMVLYAGNNIEAVGVSFEAGAPDYVIEQSATFAFDVTELTNWNLNDLQEAIEKSGVGKVVREGDIIVTTEVNSSGSVMIIIAHD